MDCKEKWLAGTFFNFGGSSLYGHTERKQASLIDNLGQWIQGRILNA